MAEEGRRLRQASETAEASDWTILMARAQAGDGAAYRRLLTEMTPYLRAIARRHGIVPAEVEDAVQDVLLTIHVIRHTYDPARPFGPWLVTVARRRIIDRLRYRQRRAGVEVAFEPRHETFAAAETNLHEAGQGSGGLRRAIEQLPAGQRRAIVLLKLRELSLREAAQESGKSIASLKVAVHRGLKALRKFLRKDET